MQLSLKTRQGAFLCSILIVLCYVLPAHVCGEEVIHALSNWPQWRGPLGTGVAPNGDPPIEFSETKNIRWKVALPGKGHSTPIIWGDSVFLTTAVPIGAPLKEPRTSGRAGAHDNLSITHRHEFIALAINRRNGQILWKKKLTDALPQEGGHYTGSLASASPVTDGERVYVYFGMVGLFCYDFDGNLVWTKDFGGYRMDGDWGTGSSPILYDGSLYLQMDNEEDSFLVALDPETGDEQWRVQRDEVSSWSTPMIWRNKVRTELVTCGKFVRSYDPASGELLWMMDMQGGRASASPVGNSDTLFLGNERRSDGGGALFAIKAGASGDISPAGEGSRSDSILWIRREGGPEFASPLLYRGNLYVFGRNRGSVGCFDPSTGERIQGLERLPGARSFWSSPWGHEGRVFCVDEAGTTFVISAGSKVELLAKCELDEEFRASPALIDGAIILRGKNKVYCIAE